MDRRYTREKLKLAIECMATRGKGLKRRLRHAFYPLHVLTVQDFPSDAARARFAELSKILTSKAPKHGDESALEVSTRDMSNAEARRAAQLIVELFCDAAGRR